MADKRRERAPGAMQPGEPRRPPYSEEAETGVLGSILQDAAILDLCVEGRVAPESFYVPAHKLVYEVMLDLSRKSRPIDLITVSHALKDVGTLEQIGGETFLHRMIDATPTTAHADYYISVVRQKHILREIIERARNAEGECYTTEGDAFELLGRVEQSFFDITDSSRGPIPAWPDMVRSAIAELDKGAGAHTGVIKTGFTEIDQFVGGFRPGNMIVLAARPSMGKTSLAMNMVENMALGHDQAGGEPVPAGIFSLEMSREDLVLRMLCTKAKVSMHKIRSGYLSGRGDEHRALVSAASVLGKAPIYLDDAAGLDVMELRARARRMKQRYKVQFIVVDYLQLLHCREKAVQGRQFEIAAVSGQIKAMAKELGIPIMVLSQLSRAPEQRGTEEGRPRLSDLRDSGSIEQDADVVLMLRRPCRMPNEEAALKEDRRLAILELAKNRNGPVRESMHLNFDEEFTRFETRAQHGVDGPPGPEQFVEADQ